MQKGEETSAAIEPSFKNSLTFYTNAHQSLPLEKSPELRSLIGVSQAQDDDTNLRRFLDRQ